MKKITKTVLTIFLLSSFTFFNGCDELENFELNIPIEIEFTVYGPASESSDTIKFCLNQYDVWNDNKDNIEKIEYLKAGYWTIEYDQKDIRGTVYFSLTDGDGSPITSGMLPNISPGDYYDGVEIELESEDIDVFNAKLSELLSEPEDANCENPSFIGIGGITGVTGTLDSLKGRVEFILKADVSP